MVVTEREVIFPILSQAEKSAMSFKFRESALVDFLFFRQITSKRRLSRGFSSDQSSPLAQREDSRIAANLDWRLNALMYHSVNGNSAFYSRSEKATLAEILKLDSLSQVSDPKKSIEQVDQSSAGASPSH